MLLYCMYVLCVGLFRAGVCMVACCLFMNVPVYVVLSCKLFCVVGFCCCVVMRLLVVVLVSIVQVVIVVLVCMFLCC